MNDLMPRPKRVGPPKIKPVTIGKVRFEAIHWGKTRGFGQNGGYVAALDVSSGEELWTVKVYDVVYEEPMEEDVQDVFIERMKAEGDRLLITDEKKRRYLLDPKTRKVSRP
jgi:hypothetical protein